MGAERSCGRTVADNKFRRMLGGPNNHQPIPIALSVYSSLVCRTRFTHFVQYLAAFWLLCLRNNWHQDFHSRLLKRKLRSRFSLLHEFQFSTNLQRVNENYFRVCHCWASRTTEVDGQSSQEMRGCICWSTPTTPGRHGYQLFRTIKHSAKSRGAFLRTVFVTERGL